MRNLSFVALDVETANANMASICQTGLVEYVNGTLVREWKSYIDPEDYFDQVNVSIHGITQEHVVGAPTLLGVGQELCFMLEGKVAVCHTHFDRVAIAKACSRYDIPAPNCSWLDSAKVARRAWEECASRGYGLSPVAKMLGFEFKHHDALEDAKAAAHILMKACEVQGLDVDGWLSRVTGPVNLTRSSSNDAITRAGNPDGALAGQVVVFTGALQISRQEAANIAASVGCYVAASVNRSTTLLVVGDQDITRLGGHQKSSKHRKAEELIAQGAPIRIIGESDFRELVRFVSK